MSAQRPGAATRVATGVVLATGGWWIAGAQLNAGAATSAPVCPAGSSLVTGSAGICQVVFSNPGPTSWQVPSGVTNVDVLTVGGGGVGGSGYAASGGGGGGGQVNVCTTEVVDATNPISVVVGEGGSFFSSSGHGAASSASSTGWTCDAIGGGAGGLGYTFTQLPQSGSFGGGGTSGSGEPGGAGAAPSIMEYDPVLNYYATFTASGGGGAAAPGATWTTTSAGAGGVGVTPSAGLFAGDTTAYGGGGGGGLFTPYLVDIGSNAPQVAGAGGLGGGGAGGLGGNVLSSQFASSGLAGTGGGGGGAGGTPNGGPLNLFFGGNGGSGVVIIRFSIAPSTPTQLVVTGAVRSLNASWNGSAGALSYTCTLLYGFGDPSTFSVTVRTPTCTFGGLAPNTPYGISVVARSAYGVSSPVAGFAKTKPLPTRRRHR